MKEMDQIHQQAGLQREELEAEIEKIREDESFLRDHLSISVKVLEGILSCSLMSLCLNGFIFINTQRIQWPKSFIKNLGMGSVFFYT